MDELRKDIVQLGDMVETGINKAMLGLISKRMHLDINVLQEYNAIDEIEVYIEDACLMILGLHQTLAVDLRFIIYALRVLYDLERMGDLAVKLAERVNS